MAVTLYPFLPVPVRIDTTTTSSRGLLGGASESGGLSPIYAPILYNGVLYIILQDTGGSPPALLIKVYKSVDKGATWAIVDGAAGPSRLYGDTSGGFYFDGAHTFIVAYTPDGSASFGALGSLRLQNFDLSTETWGAVYGATGAPSCYVVGQAFERPDGSILVFYEDTLVSGRLEGQKAAVYAAGAWTSFAVDANLSPGYTASGGQIASVMDSTGRIHLFGTAANGLGSINQQVYYQAINTDNSLGTFAVIVSPGRMAYSEPAISGDNVVCGVFDNTTNLPIVTFGAGLSAPVFSNSTLASLDPAVPAISPFKGAVNFAVDGTGLYAVYAGDVSGSFVIRYMGTPNLTAPSTGWTAITALSSTDADLLTGEFLGVTRSAGNTFAAMAAIPAGFSQPTEYWLGVFNPTPTVAASAPVPFGGAGGGAWCCPQFQAHNALTRRALAVERLKDRWEEWPYSSLLPPPDAIAVNGSDAGLQRLAVPAAGSTGVIVSYLVPSGFRFFLAAGLADFEGAFLPGDSLFSLVVNPNNGFQSRPVEGLINQPVPLGSWRDGQQWEFLQPYEFAPLDLVQWQAKNVNLNPGAPNYYVGGLFGWLVPVVK